MLVIPRGGYRTVPQLACSHAASGKKRYMIVYRSLLRFFAAAIILSGPVVAPHAQAQTPAADSFNPAPEWYVHGLALQRNG